MVTRQEDPRPAIQRGWLVGHSQPLLHTTQQHSWFVGRRGNMLCVRTNVLPGVVGAQVNRGFSVGLLIFTHEKTQKRKDPAAIHEKLSRRRRTPWQSEQPCASVPPWRRFRYPRQRPFAESS